MNHAGREENLDQQSIDAIRDLKIAPQSMIVGGQGVSASNGDELDVLSPINGKQLTSIPNASASDVEKAKDETVDGRTRP